MSKKTDRIVAKASATVARRHVASDPSPVVSSDSSPDFVNPGSSEKIMSILNLVTTPRKSKSIAYRAPGLVGIVRFSRSAFVGNAPETLPDNVSEWPLALGKAKAKMTKEERAAARLLETPATRLAKAKAQAARQAEKIAKLEAAAAL